MMLTVPAATGGQGILSRRKEGCRHGRPITTVKRMAESVLTQERQKCQQSNTDIRLFLAGAGNW